MLDVIMLALLNKAKAAFTAGNGIGIENNIIRTTFGDEFNETVYNAPMDATNQANEKLWIGFSFTEEALLNKNDTVSIIAGDTYRDLRFVDLSTGDIWKQNLISLFASVGEDIRYGILVNCHGLNIDTATGEAYLVADSDGTEQTEPAFALSTMMDDNTGENILGVLANKEAIVTGNFEISAKRFVKLPDNSYTFGEVAENDNRPVSGDAVSRAIAPPVVELESPQVVTLINKTEYSLSDVSNVSIIIPEGRIESYMELTTAESGGISISFAPEPSIEFAGEIPVFGNSEKWVLRIKNRIVSASKVLPNQINN